MVRAELERWAERRLVPLHDAEGRLIDLIITDDPFEKEDMPPHRFVFSPAQVIRHDDLCWNDYADIECLSGVRFSGRDCGFVAIVDRRLLCKTYHYPNYPGGPVPFLPANKIKTNFLRRTISDRRRS